MTEDAFRSPRHSIEVSFTSGDYNTDYGYVVRYRDFTFTDFSMLRTWYYGEKYRHDGTSYDDLHAGVRLRLYDVGGTNYATFQYWLAAWYHATDTRTPDANSRLINGRPPMNQWTEFVGFPRTDFGGDWTSATRVRVELYVSSAGTVGDEFQMYFDDFSYGGVTSKVTYVWTDTLQGDQTSTDCRSVSFTVPTTAVSVQAWLSFPPANSDFDLSLYDNLGRRTGGFTRADRNLRANIPNSDYSGISKNPESAIADPPATFGTWRVGCWLRSGNGHYELRVDVFVTETLGPDQDGTRYSFSVAGSPYSADAELRFPAANDYDLSVLDDAGRRTGGRIRSDLILRTDIPNSVYSGFKVAREWIYVDPPATTGIWSAMAYAFNGSGYYELDVRARGGARFWSVNVQDGDVDSNIGTARALFDQHVVPLGVAHVRTDFSWTNVEPNQPGVYNRAMVDFYRFFASAAKARGMDVIVILKNPPGWATTLYNLPLGVGKPQFFAYWQQYCRSIAAEMGTYVDYYQIGNEENFEFIFADEDLPTLSSRCMTGLAAGEGVGESTHARAFKTAINMAAQLLPWIGLTRNWVNAAPSSIDVLGIDHYPGTKDCTAFTNWAPLSDLIGLAKQLGKEAAIMEMGAAWYGGCWANGLTQQAKFAYEAISTISDIVAPHNRAFPRNRVVLASWYEMIDPPADIGCLPAYECNFGLIDSHGIRFPVYGVFKAKVADFGRWSIAQRFDFGLVENQGGGVALANMNGDPRMDAIFMVVDNVNVLFGDHKNYYYYRVGWDMSPDGTFASVSPTSGLFGPFDVGCDETQGAGVTVGDVNRNGLWDALFMIVCNPSGPNDYRYRVAFDIQTSGPSTGTFSAWTDPIGGPFANTDESQGAGASFADIDRNGILDAVFMTIANPGGANDFRYNVGWNIQTNGIFTSWSLAKGAGDAMGEESQGGGVVVTDWDGDGQLDLVLSSVDNPTFENNYRFKIGRSLNTAGDVRGGFSQGWGFEMVPSHENQGGDIALGDIDRDGRRDMLFMAIDNPGGNNAFVHRVRLAL